MAMAQAPRTVIDTWLGSHQLQLSVVILCAVFTFFPIYWGLPSTMESDISHEGFASRQYRESSFAILGLNLASLFDFLIDYFNELYSPHKNNSKVKVVVNIETLTYLAGTTVVPLVALVPPDTPNISLIYVCASRAQFILLAGFAGVMCCRCYRACFPVLVVSPCILLFMISTMLQTWSVNEGDSAMPLRYAFYCTQWISSGIFLICALVWAYYEFFLRLMLPRFHRFKRYLLRLWRRMRALHTSEEELSISSPRLTSRTELRKQHAEVRLFFPFMYVCSAILCIIFLGICSNIQSDLHVLSPESLLLLNIPVLVFQIVMSVLSSQCTKHDLVEYLYALLESKKSYVRYISHELRTPMNTACMGLNMLLTAGDRMNPEAVQETLVDINTSCMTAVDILNDLLSFEKLESGILQLHKENVLVLPFLKECVDMFALHARSKGVELISMYQTGYDSVSENYLGETSRHSNSEQHASTDRLSLALCDCDTISIDKFKVSQVIRNLVSNAMKFTPSGGKVTVKAYFHEKKRTTPQELSKLEKRVQKCAERRRRILRSISPSSAEKEKYSESSNKSKKQTHESSVASDGNRRRKASVAVTTVSAGVSSDQIAYQTPDRNRNDEKDISAVAHAGEGEIGGKDNRRDEREEENNGKNEDNQEDNEQEEGEGCEGRLVIEVIDSGCGISTENQRKLFQEVVQFNPEKLQAGGGSGLGLWITKGIVDLHGGSVSVFSKGEGHGCTFKVELPMTLDVVRRKAANSASSAVNSAAIPPVPAMNTDIDESHNIRIDGDSRNNIKFSVRGYGSRSPQPSGLRKMYTLQSGKDPDADADAGADAQQVIDYSINSTHGREDKLNAIEGPEATESTGVQVNPLQLSSLASPHNPQYHHHNHNQKQLHSVAEADLPLQLQPQAQSQQLSQSPSQARLQPKYRLLLVDDSHLNRKMLSRVMDAEGHEYEVAEDGKQAIERIQRLLTDHSDRPFDAVLMDFVMPLVDGPSATRRIRQLGYRGKIFGLTGNALQSDIDEFMNAGADKVLIKPLDMQLFRDEMARSVAESAR